MEITLNGQAREIDGPTTLSELLVSLGLGGKPVVAELNREAVLPRHFPETPINAGDCLEIITLAAGG
jgi:thiamine biosynthesis protein ThiS